MVDGQLPQVQRVNLAELLEVRSGGLAAQEILILLATSCEYLIRAGNRRGLFTTEHIFLTSDGRIEIQLIPIGDTPKQSIPPELLDQSQPFGQGASDSHLVWCLGQIYAQTSIANHSDIALFSLLNLMTVSHLQSRPTLQKVRQMVRNRLDVIDVERGPEIICGLYREVMGNLDELIEDPFGDDIRFSSSRSSQMSIIPGPGAPEHRERRDLDAYQQELASEVADRLRRDFSLSRKHSPGTGQTFGPFDEEMTIPDTLRPQQKPIPSPRRVISPQADIKTAAEKDMEEEELTPRGPSPIGDENNPFYADEEEEFIPIKHEKLLTEKERKWQKKEEELGQNNPFFEESDEEDGAQIEHNNRAMMINNSRPNAESIQVEVHPPSHSEFPPGTHLQDDSTMETSSHSPSSQPKRLYAKAGHMAANKAARAVTKNKIPEIEVEKDKRPDSPTSYYEDDYAIDGAETAIPTLGYSPGTRRKQMFPTKLEEETAQKYETGGRANDQQFRRQNSLQPARCSRRASSGPRAANTMGRKEGAYSNSRLPAVPEFLYNSGQPNIRLRAQSMKKKRMVVTLHRAEPAVVLVHLLDGHSIEVNCKTDQLVGSIFHTVAEHLDITEHLFFGLVLQQSQGESIFLEEEHRLEKWAPPGWKNGAGLRRSFGAGGTLPRSPLPLPGQQFTLHLRFRYYPKKREFVKTPITAHQLYLQLRQDMLSGALRFQPREKAVEMAALALCVECGNPPSTPGDYFKLENYLPSKFYDVEPGEIVQLHREIIAAHAKMAEHFGRLEAEERFIQQSQSEPYYGAHFYRVHKMKPKRGQQPLYSDHRIVAVMPSGIGICREERGGTRRLFTSLHEWHQIRTLQFDRKRFLLGTLENGLAVDHVFYTDHHSKSAYLVRFAASQHRFMLKMRQWQGTLNRMRAMQRHRDVGVETAAGAMAENHHQQQRSIDNNGAIYGADGGEGNAFPITRPNGHLHQPQMGIRGGEIGAGENSATIDGRRQSHLLAETDKEYIQYCYGPDAQRLDVILEKHPEFGLGLTLVDGAVNGVKGVYVKSVSSEGDGRRKGLLIGDCLLSINGISLFNRSRHDAVELVRDCGDQVQLEILRFPSISEVLAKEPIQNVLNTMNGKSADLSSQKTMMEEHSNSPQMQKTPQNSAAIAGGVLSARRRTSSSFLEETAGTINKVRKSTDVEEKMDGNRKESTITTQSRTSADSANSGTPQSGISTSGTSQSAAQHRRQRAVSDFGAFGGNLPALRTDDILATTAITPKGRNKLDEHRAQRYKRHKTSAGFPESRNSDEGEDISTDSDAEDINRSGQSGGTTGSSSGQSAQRRGEYLPKQLPPVSAMYGTLEDEEDEDEQTEDEEMNRKYNNNRNKAKYNPTKRGNIGEQSSSPFVFNNNITNSPFAAAVERYTMMDNSRNNISNGSGNNGKNGRTNLDWTNDLSDHFDMIGGGYSSPFGSSQREENGEEIHTVTLHKTSTSPIGLSVAKRMGYEGVFVRNIAPESLAAQEGTLKVGDRIWSIQGHQLALDESPANVVRKLKDMNGQLEIQVKRK